MNSLTPDRPHTPGSLARVQYLYLRRRALLRIVHAIGLTVIVGVTVAAFGGANGPWLSRIVIGYAVVFAGYKFFGWRCPHCGRPLVGSNPKACAQCGVQLHEERPVGTA